MSISVLLPAYKEAENIPFIIPRLKSTLNKLNIPYEILIIDTISPMDDTVMLCQEFDVTYCPRKGGDSYGDAIRTGFSSAQYERVVVMDCDGSHYPEIIAKFWKNKDKADLIIGSRYIKGGKTDNSAVLILMSWMVNLVYRIILGINVQDISNSFRMYKSEQIKVLILECSHFDLVEEILIKLQLDHKNFCILEVPIIFEKRNAGQSKRNLFKFIGSYISTLWKLYFIKYNYHKNGNSKRINK